eukprot:scaffold289730_cov36-Tisochrysis_lutea.AAC.1
MSAPLHATCAAAVSLGEQCAAGREEVRTQSAGKEAAQHRQRRGTRCAPRREARAAPAKLGWSHCFLLLLDA